MTVNEFTKDLLIWRNTEEQTLLDDITEPRVIASFNEREQAIIEGLIRKSLLTRVSGKDSTYVYPNV
jgi:hypothetical protein